MTGYIEPPPPQPRRMGCLGKGCLILALFALFLLIACAVGIYFGLKTYSAVFHGVIWAENARALSPQPSPVPQFETTEEKIAAAVQKWDAFESAARRKEPAHIELTADDLNNLISRDQRLRGKAFATIEGNRLRIQASLPLGQYARHGAYYLNGDIVIESEGPRSLEHPPLNSITINNHALPSDLPEWKLHGRPLHEYFGYQRDRVDTFEIREGKLVLDKRPG